MSKPLSERIASIFCQILGHTRYSGWWGDGLYGDVYGPSEDGTGRTHFTVRTSCDRCGKRYVLARFHGSQVTALQEKERHE